MKTILSILSVFSAIFFISSCDSQPSDEEIKAAIETTVTKFSDAVVFGNEDKAAELYPTLEDCGIISISQLNSQSYTYLRHIDNEDGTYSVHIEVDNGNDDIEKAFLIMKPTSFEKDNVKFEIIDSKGLTVWRFDTLCLYYGCWSADDQLTDKEYYQRQQTAYIIHEERQKNIKQEVEDNLVIEDSYGYPQNYDITNNTPYMLENITISFTYDAEETDYYGRTGNWSTISDIVTTSIKPGKTAYNVSTTSTYYNWTDLEIKSISISDVDAYAIAMASAKGTEYEEYIAKQKK